MSVSLAFRRLFYSSSVAATSASTITIKPTPSKSHLHSPIPSTAFPKGYLLTGVYGGVKKKTQALDVAIILSTSGSALDANASTRKTTAAACFTRNVFKAAPVLVSEEVLVKNGGRARALIVNSGCANAVTGKQGMQDAWDMVHATDALLSTIDSKKVIDGEPETLVMSTGVIGQNLPISHILSAIQSQSPSLPTCTLSNDFAAWERAAQAFMTTDTFPKLRARSFEIGGVTYRMAGMDKGAGMIHPNMGPPRAAGQLHATLLGCILTDAPVSEKSLQNALTYAVDRSFNSISVDGEMSTNDTIVVLANGAAADEHNANITVGSGVEAVKEIDEATDKEGYDIFKKELTEFAIDLAQLVVRDGEGATKFVTVTVKNGPSYQDAHRIASRISTSALVKTALYGEDANWGRILSATGSIPLTSTSSLTNEPLTLDPTKVSVSFLPSPSSPLSSAGPLHVLTNGEPEIFDEGRAKKLLMEQEINVQIDLGFEGGEEAKYWTCDFSYEYVQINGDYRS